MADLTIEQLTHIVQRLEALVARQRHDFCDDDESLAELQFGPSGRLGKQHLHDTNDENKAGPLKVTLQRTQDAVSTTVN